MEQGYFLFVFSLVTSRMVSYYLLFGLQSIDLMLAFSVIFTCVYRPQTLSHVTKIRMQVVNVLFKICVAEWANIIKIVNGPHSVNAKSLSSASKSYGVSVPTRFRLSKRNNNLDP